MKRQTVQEVANVFVAVFLASTAVMFGGCVTPSGPPIATGQAWTVPASGTELVWIEELHGWVSKYEITNEEFRRFEPDHTSRGHGFALQLPLNGDRQPAVVQFMDAERFAKWLNDQEKARKRVPAGYIYRLPSNEEWTFLARCGDDRRFPWGNDMPPAYGNYGDKSYAKATGAESQLMDQDDGFAGTCPVEASGADPRGLYGVGGNIREWTSWSTNVWPSYARHERGADFRTSDPFWLSISNSPKTNIRALFDMEVEAGRESYLSLPENTFYGEDISDVGFRIVLLPLTADTYHPGQSLSAADPRMNEWLTQRDSLEEIADELEESMPGMTIRVIR